MELSTLREVNLSRSARWHPEGIDSWSLSDWGVATAGEMGEALNIVKKLNRERDALTGNSNTLPELHQMLADELADTMIYLDLMAARAGINLSKAIAEKFNRTSEKNNFPERLQP